MIHMLLIVFGLSSLIAPVFGSEKGDEITIFRADVGTLNHNPLRYCDREYVDFLKNIYGISCEYNEPFLWVNHRPVSEERQSLRKELVERITFVPFRYFMKDDNDPRDSVSFKQSNNILLSCSKLFTTTKNKFQIQLVSDFGDKNPQDLLEQFKEIPRCALGNCFNEEGSMLMFVDETDVEKELCDADIISKKEGLSYFETVKGKNMTKTVLRHKYRQGPNGYFGEAVKAEQKVKEQALFFSRCKKFCGISITAILMYILYNKFYTITG